MKRVFIAGHRGMVGSAIWRLLNTMPEYSLLGIERSFLDLRDEVNVVKYLEKNQVDVVIDAAAVVGGIFANANYPYTFLLDNLRIQNSLIKASVTLGIKEFIFLGSSCIYPKYAPQPIKESYLLTGPLEETNEFYAIAKISGLKLCQAVQRQFGFKYVCLMPSNLYGTGDNFDLKTAHVLPAMINKFHFAKVTKKNIDLWGTGLPYREFLHVDDLARAVLLVLKSPDAEFVYNVGTGIDFPIKDLANLIAKIVDYDGIINWDHSKPDGTPKKLLDITKIKELGWEPRISLEKGLSEVYKWFLENQNSLRKLSIK